MGPEMKPLAPLRVCASCEWIFLLPAPDGCPKCQFGHYAARFVYGKRAYRYAVTQQPWFDKKVERYKMALRAEIAATNPPRAVITGGRK